MRSTAPSRRGSLSTRPRALPGCDGPPYFWQIVQNSLIVVLVAVGVSVVVAFIAAVLAKYRFTGRKLFIVLMIGILMLPAAGLVIPLYVVLARIT